MRRLLSASFRNRLFAALLAASLIPCCCAPPCCCRSSACGWRTGPRGRRTAIWTAWARPWTRPAGPFPPPRPPWSGTGCSPRPSSRAAPPRERSTACSWRTSSPPRPWPAWICTTARGTGTAPPAAPPDGACPPSGGCCTRPGNGGPSTLWPLRPSPGTSNSPVLWGRPPGRPDGAGPGISAGQLLPV